MPKLTHLFVALTVVLPMQATAEAAYIQATFDGSFTTRMSQQPAGELVTTEIELPFTSIITIYLDSEQFYEYRSANTTQTMFAGPLFDTSLTQSIMDEHSLSATPTISYSHSVYWFGYNPQGARNDFMSFATANFYDQAQNEQWIYQLVIRAGISVPQSQESGPITDRLLYEGLFDAKSQGKSFSVTEFYELYPLTGGPRAEANWFSGSAQLTEVSVVPEPSTAFLLLSGLLALTWRRSNFTPSSDKA